MAAQIHSIPAGPRAAPPRSMKLNSQVSFRSVPALSAPQRRRHIARVGGFDEGAAQVRRLLDRDRKEMDLDELENVFADATVRDDGQAGSEEGPSPASSGARFAADKTPVSPLGPSSSSPSPITAAPAAVSPFGSTSALAKKPFGEPAGLSPTMQPDVMDEAPWWTQITLTQAVIAASFTTIILLMIATFFVVLNLGAIRINE